MATSLNLSRDGADARRRIGDAPMMLSKGNAGGEEVGSATGGAPSGTPDPYMSRNSDDAPRRAAS